MIFINEYIPEEDFEKYNFAELNKRPRGAGSTPARYWTIDREANIWLHKFYTESDHTEPDGGYTGLSYWNYFWKGTLIMLEIKLMDAGGKRGGHCWARKKLISIDLPDKLETQRSEVLKDLEAALTAYKDGGVLSSSSSYTLEFEV